MGKLRIVFMGTPEFASTILESLIDSDEIEIICVVTAPDRPSGRGQNIKVSEVKKVATNHKLYLLQPTNLKEASFVSRLESMKAELFVVIAFRILPEVVWSIPPKGTINLHASLLPQYRGAAPINWAIINGEHETGVTTFIIERGIDTGEILQQNKLDIGLNETVGHLYARLMILGAETTLSTIRGLNNNNLTPARQTELHEVDTLNAAPKIFKADCQLKFNINAADAHNFCRGLDPYPGAWCYLYNDQANSRKSFKLFNSEETTMKVSGISILTSKEGMLFPCSDFYLLIKEIQPEGKRRMTSNEFLVGNSADTLHILPVA